MSCKYHSLVMTKSDDISETWACKCGFAQLKMKNRSEIKMDRFMAMSLIMKELSETGACYFTVPKHGANWEFLFAKTVELIKSFGYNVEIHKVYDDGTLSPVNQIPEGNKTLIGKRVAWK